MPATTTGAPFSLNVPSLSSDLADLFGTYLVPNMTAINTNAAHKGTAQTFSALQTFSAGLNVSSGNVGIGTSSPDSYNSYGNNLVVKNTTSTGITIVSGSVDYGSIHFADGTTGADSYRGQIVYNHTTNALSFSTDASERMRINASGSVGIGTSSPSAALHVVSSAAYDARFESGYPQALVIQNGGLWEPKSASDTADISFHYVGYNNGTTYYRDVNIWNGKSALIARFQGSTGRLGIGTGSPSTGLHVNTSDGAITLNNTGGTDSTIYLNTTGTLKWSITQAPLAGDRLYIRDDQTNDGVYMAQNTTSWTANSDSRLKDVQGTITDALAKVGQLTGVKFTWKRDADNPDAKVRVGLIAQDVQAVLPEAVDDESPDLITDEETGKVSGGLGVRYTEVVPLLVNAIKELTARVVALEAQVASA